MAEIINLNNINNLELLSLKNESVEQQYSIKSEQKTENRKDASNDSTRLELSQSVLKKLNNYIGTEDLLTKKLNTAQNIYDRLGDVQTELLNLKNKLIDTPAKNTDELIDIEEKSNNIINKVISILKTDTFGIVDSKYLDSVFNKLTYIHDLPIVDNNYLDKINNLDSNITKQSNIYELASKNLYENLVELHKKIDEEAKTTENKDATSNDLQNKVVTNPIETVKSAIADLTPEAVLRLIQVK